MGRPTPKKYKKLSAPWFWDLNRDKQAEKTEGTISILDSIIFLLEVFFKYKDNADDIRINRELSAITIGNNVNPALYPWININCNGVENTKMLVAITSNRLKFWLAPNAPMGIYKKIKANPKEIESFRPAENDLFV